MSLTNPNSVVTEQRLADFYQGIFPYLGGMPEMLANKFSKGDLYSTDEKIVGTWIDGKPLYQKVVQLTSSDIPNGNIKYKNHDISDLDYVVYLSGMIRQIDNVSFTALPRVQDNSVANLMALDINKTQLLIKGRGTTFTETFNGGFVLIKYTKTTDSPISIGSDTDYSTEEKIIGTWVDKKPVYQRVINGTTPSTKNNSVSVNIGCTIDSLVSLNGYIYANNSSWLGYQSIGSDVSSIGITYDKSMINVYISHDYLVSKPFVAIIQYTKSTD